MTLRFDLEPDEVQLLLSAANRGLAALCKKIVDQANDQAEPPPAAQHLGGNGNSAVTGKHEQGP